MKKAGIFLLALFLFLIFINILVKAQDTYLPPEVKGVEKLQNVTEQLTDEEKREYLFQEWQKILLGNKFVAAMDSFFTEYSMFFRIVFGMPYSLSLTLVFVIILWLFIALGISDLTRGKKDDLGLLGGLSYILGIVAAVVLAQLQILRRISAFLVKLIFYPESAWARFIVFVVIIAILILLYYLKGGLSQASEQSRKKRKEKETEQKQKEIKKFTKGLEEGAGI